MSAGKHRNDLLLAGVILLAALIGLLLLRLRHTPGGEAVVQVGGQEVARYALTEPVRVTIGDEARHNTLVIENGEAWIEDASCPDLLCEKQGRIRYTGEQIICLPNQLVVQIEAAAETVDAVIG